MKVGGIHRWLLGLQSSSLLSALSVGLGWGSGSGTYSTTGLSKSHSSSTLSGSRGETGRFSGTGSGSGKGEGGGRTFRGEGMHKRSGDMGLRAGEWDGVAAADSAEEEGAVGFRYASAIVMNPSIF